MVVSSPAESKERHKARDERELGYEMCPSHASPLGKFRSVRHRSAATILLTIFMAGFSASSIGTPSGSSRSMPESAAISQYGRGVAFLSGKSGVRDYKQALYWLLKSAELNYAPAQVAVARIYFNGLGVTADAREGASWFRKAAEQGYSPAQVSIGLLYRNGEGVSRDYAVAMNWFKKAAAKGDAYAAVSLGFMYAQGQGVERDAKQALSWFERAAETGDPAAQSVLGGVYVDGSLTAPDYVEAYKWFSLAASGGDESAQLQLGKLERKMSPASVQSAQRSIGVWRPSNR